MPARYITYDAFGNIAAETDVAIAHLFGYTGREFDKGTGLQYNRERYYDPKSGRFISQDPIGFAAGDANLYRYVGNHGTYATDPSGNVERGKSSTVPGLDKAIRSTGGFGSGQIIAKDETGLRFIDVDVNPFYLPSPNSNGSTPHSGNDIASFEVNVTENNTCQRLLVNWRLNCDGSLGDEGPASTQEIGKPFYVGQNPSGSMRATTDEEHARFRGQELQRLLAEHALAVEYRKQEQLNRLETELTREYPRE